MLHILKSTTEFVPFCLISALLVNMSAKCMIKLMDGQLFTSRRWDISNINVFYEHELYRHDVVYYVM